MPRLSWVLLERPNIMAYVLRTFNVWPLCVQLSQVVLWARSFVAVHPYICVKTDHRSTCHRAATYTSDFSPSSISSGDKTKAIQDQAMHLKGLPIGVLLITDEALWCILILTQGLRCCTQSSFNGIFRKISYQEILLSFRKRPVPAGFRIVSVFVSNSTKQSLHWLLDSHRPNPRVI